ncbi:MAG: ABC transporter permease [Pontibacterium sp.]
MTSLSTPAELEDSSSLKSQLRRSQRKQKLKAILLISPLFIFVMSVFITPIGIMLLRSVDNPEVHTNWPQTTAVLKQWDGAALPDDLAFLALSQDLRSSFKDKTLSSAAKRINYERSGMRSTITRTARKLQRTPLASASEERDKLLLSHKRWGELQTWQAIKSASEKFTPLYLLNSVDLKQDSAGDVVKVHEDQAIYLNIFGRTLWISLVVTLSCLLIGYPLAYLLATARPGVANLLMIGVLLPFWTSLLVRTSAWVVLLQKNGIINDLLLSLHIINEPLVLLFNRPGVYLALIHLLLPFMILSLYSVMKSISPAYMRAAISLGAPPSLAFIKVYIPQTLPGVAAGGLLCFILSIGYYITPALIGSPQDQMISYFIAYYTNQVINWGMAAALGVVLLICCGLLFAVYNRLANKHDLKAA